MVTIRSFGNPAEASLALSVLESAGIPSTLVGEHAYTLGPQYVPEGIRLQVAEQDAERAFEILENEDGVAALPDDFVPPELPPNEQPPSKETDGSSPARTFFLYGGLSALLFFTVVFVAVLITGGRIYADLGGIIFIFLLGGIVGLVVREIYKRDKKNNPRR